MEIVPIKTPLLRSPKVDLLKVIKEALPTFKNRSILVVASKVVSLWQGRCVLMVKVKDKDKLIIEEAEQYLPRPLTPGGWVLHTLKNNLLIPSAGIDESNGRGYFVLWPKKPQMAARKIWEFCRQHYQVKDFGVVIADSHSVPLRRGVVGISLGYFGFKPLKDYRGTKDLFGKEFVFSQTNIVDSLASAAVLVMGEGKEQTPLAVATDIPFIQFANKPFSPRRPFSTLEVKPKEDLYYPFLSHLPWKKGGALRKAQNLKRSKKQTRIKTT